MYITIY